MTTSGQTTPLISVILPVFNDAGRLPRSVAAIQTQTFTDWEMIIVDDGSSDESYQVACELAAADPRIRALTKANGGPGSARNAGMAVARGSLIAVADSDDTSEPERLQREVDFLAANSSVGVVASYGYRVGAGGSVLGILDSGPTTVEQYRWLRDNARAVYLLHSSVLMRKDLLGQVGGYPDNQGSTEDFALFNLRLAPITDMVVLKDRLVRYEVRPDSVTRRFASRNWRFQEMVKLNLRRRHQGLPDLSVEEFLRFRQEGPLRERLRLRFRENQYVYYTRGAAALSHGSIKGGGLLLLAFAFGPRTTVARLYGQIFPRLRERVPGLRHRAVSSDSRH